jgi:polysaccharide pyruvyl transferase WcaK-like protein
MFVTLTQSPIVSDLSFILEKAGIPGFLVSSVWYIAKKLAEVYDQRIESLEKANEKQAEATKKCEEHRFELQRMFYEKFEDKAPKA